VTKFCKGLARFAGALALATLVALVAGCASVDRVDWAGRVGHYSYDDAVKEFGPPDGKETLTDGGIVAKWVLEGRREFVSSGLGWYGYGPRYRRWRGGPPPGWYSTPELLLRMEFGQDHQLVAAKQYER